ncbi:hypothetical protein B0H21DRAFT_689810 [Amylocystis lapponica]|nr:hypothetical protein B0H21DRAFT_689810 [Amylocystis lapponica]
MVYGTYPNRAFAAGLYVGTPYKNIQHHAAAPLQQDWNPAWTVFPLKAFRGTNYTLLQIKPDWDDADLLRELKNTYDALRTVWRKWFSLKSVGCGAFLIHDRSISITMNDHSFVYPQRVGPARVSAHRNLRLRWFLHNPDSVKGSREFMQVLTHQMDLGIEFVERWEASRIAIAILLPVFLSLVAGVVYSACTRDASSGFTIAGYMTSAYSVCLVLVGVLNLVEF